jgi:hypothetical protein
MQRAGVNRPFGPRYRDLFGLLLRQFKFTDRIKDSGDRARLVEVMEILPEIETLRNGRKALPPGGLYRLELIRERSRACARLLSLG